MKPHFRSDLRCSREEQQGVVFYRVDDPRTESNFRLYEIEYLIAQKLDGVRTIDDVIAAVKDDYEFDISRPDLERFVSQLESMGFLEKGSSSAGRSVSELATEEGAESWESPTVALGSEALSTSVTDAPAIDFAPIEDADKSELARLYRSAFLHVKQGYLVHARDYLLAARELEPRNDKLNRLVGNLEIVGDTPSAAEIDFIWEQCVALVPELAAEVGPIVEGTLDGESSKATLHVDAEEDIKTRIMWLGIAAAVFLLVGGALFWAVDAFDVSVAVIETAEPVKVVALESQRVPVYYEKSAESVRPVREQDLVFQDSGRVEKLLVGEGEFVKEGDLIASLELPAKLAKQLRAAERTVAKAKAAYDKVHERLAALLAQKEQLELERERAVEQLRELQPKQLLGRGGVSKRDIEKWKRAKVQANKKLTKLAQKERKPRAQDQKAKKKLDAAQKKLDAVEAKLGGKLLKAPFGGRLVELEIKEGSPVGKGRKIGLLRDENDVLLKFSLESAPSFQSGGQAFIAVKRSKPTAATVEERKDVGDGAEVVIRMPDPTGVALATEPEEFRLVREYVDPAFVVPSSALVERNAESRVFVVRQKRATAYSVDILQRDPAQVVIRDKRGSLRNGDQLVTAHIEHGGLEQLRDGASLEIH